MSLTKAVFAGALLIAASVLFSDFTRSAKALDGGPYALMQHSNTAANAGVFRLDVTSGDVSYCYMATSSDLRCTNWVH